MSFVGRQQDLREFEADYLSPRSELVILYGRRRIGKSTLLEKFAQGKPCFFFQAGKEKKQRTRGQVSYQEISRSILCRRF